MSFISNPHIEEALLPYSVDYRPISSKVSTLSIDLILTKSANKNVSIHQLQCPLAVPLIRQELSFILLPKTLHISQVRVIYYRLLVIFFVIVQFSLSVEAIHVPLSIIDKLILVIEKFSLPMHPVFLPFSQIKAAVFVIECAKAISHSIFDMSFVLGASLI